MGTINNIVICIYMYLWGKTMSDPDYWGITMTKMRYTPTICNNIQQTSNHLIASIASRENLRGSCLSHIKILRMFVKMGPLTEVLLKNKFQACTLNYGTTKDVSDIATSNMYRTQTNLTWNEHEWEFSSFQFTCPLVALVVCAKWSHR